MADTTFIDRQTPIPASWLNDVNDVTYNTFTTFFGTGGDDTVALQALLTAGKNIQLVGTIYANNLLATTAGQHLKGVGRAQIIKNANGPLITFSAANQRAESIEFRGDASAPTFTGPNVVSTADNFQFFHCGSQWAYAEALVLQGGHPLVMGQMGIIQSSLLGATYDIDCGVDGVGKLYGRLIGVYTSQNTGGIRFTDTGAWSVSQSQFAKLTVQMGGGGYVSGSNGGMYLGNRITGDVSVGISSSTFAGNVFGGSTITFVSGTSGHAFGDSNAVSSGTTIVDDSNASNVIDTRQIPLTSYTPSWTASTTNPVLGNGTLTGYSTKRGRVVTVALDLVCGGTTTYGSGTYYFSLPFIPSTSISFMGSALILDSGTIYRTGTVQTLLDGTARCQVTVDSDNGQIGPTRPMTWAVGDTLKLSLTYQTAS